MLQQYPENIFLIGPMGAGKSTIGRQLAEEINYSFIDSDKIITDRTGVDIPTIFEFEGEKGFRKREEEILTELVNNKHTVLATGGGAILNTTVRKLLNQNGFVIYLQTTVAEQLKRIGDDTNRPLMQSDNPQQQLEHLMQQRAPLYEATADLIFDTNRYKIKHISHEIIKNLKSIYA